VVAAVSTIPFFFFIIILSTLLFPFSSSSPLFIHHPFLSLPLPYRHRLGRVRAAVSEPFVTTFGTSRHIRVRRAATQTEVDEGGGNEADDDTCSAAVEPRMSKRIECRHGAAGQTGGQQASQGGRL
jgi:hypothetical protein